MLEVQGSPQNLTVLHRTRKGNLPEVVLFQLKDKGLY
jgi:hypothetical protein